MSLKRILDFFGSKSPQTKILKTNQEETGSSYCMSVSAEVTPASLSTTSSAAGATEGLDLPLLTQEVTLAAPVGSLSDTAGFERPCQPNSSFPGSRFGTETFERTFQQAGFQSGSGCTMCRIKNVFFALFAARQEKRVSATWREQLALS